MASEKKDKDGFNYGEAMNALRDLHKFNEINAEAFKFLALSHKSFYDAYIDAGFTPEQALALICAGISK